MLDDEQMEEIAHNLYGTTKNVFSMAKAMYDYDWKDEDFDKLKKSFDLLRCMECSTWKDISDTDGDFCKKCIGQDPY